MKDQRIGFMDLLKAFSILLVVFCHYTWLSKETIIGNIVMMLAWGAVPCFMMVSGALLHRGEDFCWKKYFIKIAKLYISLVAWRGIYFLVYALITDLHCSKTELIQYLLFFTELDHVDTGVMWYMMAYLVVLLFYPVTHYLFYSDKGKGRKVLIFLIGLFMFSGIILPSLNWTFIHLSELFHIHLPDLNGISGVLPFTNYVNMLFYFTLGAFLLEYRKQINEKLSSKPWLPPLLAAIGTAGLLVIKFFETGSFAWNYYYIPEGYSHVMTMILSVGLFQTASGHEYKKVNPVLSGLGHYTMGIYYMHYILLPVLSLYMYPFLKEYYSFGLNCLKTVIVTGVCMLITWLVRKIPLLSVLVK